MTETLDYISSYCGVDIFLLGPKLTPMVDGMSGDSEMRMDQRWRVAIYGDILSSEHAKARVLIQIDTLVRQFLHATHSSHTISTVLTLNTALAWSRRGCDES